MSGPAYISNSYRPSSHPVFTSPQDSRLESWSSSALQKLVQAGEWYGRVREDVRNFSSENLQLGLEKGKDIGDFLPGRAGRLLSPVSKALDAVMGIGESLEVFAKEHRAGNTLYAGTLAKMTRTTGELALSSALGISAAGAAATAMGGILLPAAVGIGAGLAGYALARSAFDFVQEKL